MADDPLSPPIENPITLDTFAVSAAVYAERDDGKILLLKRAEGSSMAGFYFLPGGLVDPGEAPFDAAARELAEESGLTFALPPTMVGCYRMFMYGQDFLQLTFRGRVAGELTLSHEHTGHRWIDPGEWAEQINEANVRAQAGDNEQIAQLLAGIVDDAQRYLRVSAATT